MLQPITGYHKDAENHWVAELNCGHGQHVRHDPPWMVRDWVLTDEGRDSRRGTLLNCVRCDEMGSLVAAAVKAECLEALASAYEQAGQSGLCGEGRWEVALDSVKILDMSNVIEKALKTPAVK